MHHWIRAPSSVYKNFLFINRILLTDGVMITGIDYPINLEKWSSQNASGISTWMWQILSCIWLYLYAKVNDSALRKVYSWEIRYCENYFIKEIMG